MKKTMMLVMLVISFFGLLCSCENVVDSSPNALIKEEFENLKKQIPQSITRDFTFECKQDYTYTFLSSLSSFREYTYVFPKTYIEEVDEVLVTISYQEVSLSENLRLNIAAWTPQNDLEEVEKEIHTKIPNETMGDIILPSLKEGSVVYSTTEKILHGKLIYDSPKYDVNCSIDYEIKLNGEKLEGRKVFIKKGIDKLPNISQLHIDTKFVEITSKEEYVEAYYTFYDENQELVLDKEKGRIRGRGNSTWAFEKKPYKIKFDQKIVLGNGTKSKDYALIANYADQSLIRNAIVYSFADKLDGLKYTPQFTYADVYLNEEYQGNYMICDQVEVAKEKVNVEKDSLQLNSGYLVEMDLKINEDIENIIDFNSFYVGGIPYVMKYPKSDDKNFSVQKTMYIKDYLIEVDNAIMQRKNYEDLIDVSSFIDYFLVQELFKNYDADHSSVFMYKDKDSKLFMGPVWDFDLAMGNHGMVSEEGLRPEGFHVMQHHRWFKSLMQDSIFKEKFAKRFLELFENEIAEIETDILTFSNQIRKSSYYNFLTWDILGKPGDWYTAPEILARDKYYEQVDFVADFMNRRINFIYQECQKWL